MCFIVCLPWWVWLLIVVAIVILYATGTAPIAGVILTGIILLLWITLGHFSPLLWLLVLIAVILSPETWPFILGYGLIAVMAVGMIYVLLVYVIPAIGMFF